MVSKLESVKKVLYEDFDAPLLHLNTDKSFIYRTESDHSNYEFHENKSKELRRLQFEVSREKRFGVWINFWSKQSSATPGYLILKNAREPKNGRFEIKVDDRVEIRKGPGNAESLQGRVRDKSNSKEKDSLFEIVTKTGNIYYVQIQKSTRPAKKVTKSITHNNEDHQDSSKSAKNQDICDYGEWGVWDHSLEWVGYGDLQFFDNRNYCNQMILKVGIFAGEMESPTLVLFTKIKDCVTIFHPTMGKFTREILMEKIIEERYAQTQPSHIILASNHSTSSSSDDIVSLPFLYHFYCANEVSSIVFPKIYHLLDGFYAKLLIKKRVYIQGPLKLESHIGQDSLGITLRIGEINPCYIRGKINPIEKKYQAYLLELKRSQLPKKTYKDAAVGTDALPEPKEGPDYLFQSFEMTWVRKSGNRLRVSLESPFKQSKNKECSVNSNTNLKHNNASKHKEDIILDLRSKLRKKKKRTKSIVYSSLGSSKGLSTLLKSQSIIQQEKEIKKKPDYSYLENPDVLRVNS